MSLRVAALMISMSLLGFACKKDEAPAPTPAPPPASVKGQAADSAAKPAADPAKEVPGDPAAAEDKAASDSKKPAGEPSADNNKPDQAKAAADKAASDQAAADAAKEDKANADKEKADKAAAAAAEEAKKEPQKLDVVPPVPVKLPDGAAPAAGAAPAPLGAAAAAGAVPATGAAPAAAGTAPVAGAAPDTGAVPAAGAAPATAVATVAAAGTPAGAATWTPPPFLNVNEGRTEVRAREAMVKMLMTGYRHAITDERVLKAMGTVPRHEYLLPENRADGYKQNWFRIGHGQTITDPGMVAWMTQLLAIKPTDKVLEIGTGSGYQGSVLAQLTPHAYTIEIVEPLAQRTHKLFARFGLDKVLKTRIGDGYYGWEEEAPFDKIIVTCAADHIPILLLQQLKPGGLMVIPVGPRYQPGKLHFIAKDAQGKIHKKVLGKVDFVPMTRLKDWGKTDERDAKRKELEKQSKEFKYEESTP